MSPFLKRQIREALAPLERRARGVVRTAILAVVALVSLFACLILLSVAGFIELSGFIGPACAALALAGIYALITLACLLAARGGGAASTAAVTQKAAKSQDVPEEVVARADPDARSQNIDEALAPILKVLQEAGLQRTNIDVLLAAAVAKQAHPFMLVATAFAMGFIFSRRKP